MKTQDWRANNAPHGPGAVIRCRCGAQLAQLAPGEQLTRDRTVAARSLACTDCGQAVKARITNGPGSATSTPT